MKIGFILSAYDRTDDLLAHLDILKFFPQDHVIIPIWMNKDSPDSFKKSLSRYEHTQYCDGISFSVGPLIAIVNGLKTAARLGLDYVIYRNGDDWLFNHQFVLKYLSEMDGKHVGAYNWISVGTNIEFAMNELCLKVSVFASHLDRAEEQFKSLSANIPCEMKIAKWINKITKSLYRMPDREQWPGIGQFGDFYGIPREAERLPPGEKEAYLEKWKNNNRFFNRSWQLIGSHDNAQRHKLYQEIRNLIPYHVELEQEPDFSRWLSSSQWNSCAAQRPHL